MTRYFSKRVGAILAAGLFTLSMPALAQAPAPVEVGGAPMLPNKSIPDNAAKASNLTTLVAAVKAAGLVQTLKGKGPFTVFAPTNAAFEKLPAGTVDTLLKPENKDQLVKILTYHVVAGRMTTEDLLAAAEQNGGKATLTTVEGGTLTVGGKDGQWAVWDESGNSAMLETRNVLQKNGVVHVIDAVLMPKDDNAAAAPAGDMKDDDAMPADAEPAATDSTPAGDRTAPAAGTEPAGEAPASATEPATPTDTAPAGERETPPATEPAPEPRG